MKLYLGGINTLTSPNRTGVSETAEVGEEGQINEDVSNVCSPSLGITDHGHIHHHQQSHQQQHQHHVPHTLVPAISPCLNFNSGFSSSMSAMYSNMHHNAISMTDGYG